MENLTHVVVTVGTIKEWHNADRQGYYSAGYYDVPAKVYECSNCGKRVGEYKLSDMSVCPHCGVKFEGETSDVFKEKCDKLIAYFQKEKTEMKEKMDRSHKKKREELRWELRSIKTNLYFFHRMLQIWQNGEISYKEFELCDEAYDEIFGKLVCENEN